MSLSRRNNNNNNTNKDGGSPLYSSGAALQRVSARSGHSSTPHSRRGDGRVQVTHVPLPFDVDPAFVFPVRANGAVGLRVKDCFDAGSQAAQNANSNLNASPPYLNMTVARTVERAGEPVDALFPDGVVVVQRGYFPAEDAPTNQTASAPSLLKTRKEPRKGFTWGHLLSLLVRAQHDPVTQGTWPRGDPWAGGLPPYEHIWVVAIRRSSLGGADGTVRWFPELEVRVPVAEQRPQPARRL